MFMEAPRWNGGPGVQGGRWRPSGGGAAMEPARLIIRRRADIEPVQLGGCWVSASGRWTVRALRGRNRTPGRHTPWQCSVVDGVGSAEWSRSTR